MADEKTEEATPYKLRKAREEGQVARSQDLAAVGSMLAVLGVLAAMAGSVRAHLGRIFALALARVAPEGQRGDDTALFGTLFDMLYQGMAVVLPLVAAAALGAAVATIMHVGFQITPKAMQPKFENLNPAQGLKRVFSMRSLLSFVQMLVKSVVIGAVVAQFILGVIPLLSGAVYQSPGNVGAVSWDVFAKLLVFVLGAFAVLAGADYLIQKRLFLKGQRMSKDEVKREYKGQEGDPEVKGRRRMLARELVESGPRQAIARSDVVVVNPTHYAVGVRYREDEAGVPVVLVKGVDEAALALRGMAEQMGVPVFANPPLARALHVVPVDGAIPEEMFEAVAAVLRWVDDIGAARPPEAGPDEGMRA